MKILQATALSIVFVIGSARVQAAVDFVKQIKPIIERSCTKCHGPEKPKGKFDLTTRKMALESGKTGESIVPGDADDSLLIELIMLPEDDEDRMPNEGDPLSKAEIDLIRTWINEGAKWPDDVTLAVPEGAGGPPPRPEDSDPTAKLPITDAERKAIDKVEEKGARTLRIAQNVNWLRVDFSLHAKETKDADLALLEDITNLYELDLGGTQITDAGLEHLENHKVLTRLHLEKTKVTGPGLAHLKGLERLSYLNLYGSGVTDAGLIHLAALKNLTKLYLWETKVTDEGVKTLQAALPKVKIDRGWDAQAVAAAAKKRKADEVKKKADAANKAVEEAKKQADAAAKTADEAAKKRDDAAKQAADAQKAAADLEKKVAEAKKKADEAQKAAEAAKKSAEEEAKKVEEAKKKIDAANKEAEAAKKKVEELAKKEADAANKEAEAAKKKAEELAKKKK